MDQAVRTALENDRTIDITTTGRRSGQTHRIEIWLHSFDGRFFLSGSPGTRDWYANLLAEPAFQLHIKQSLQADLQATARPILDPGERQPILGHIMGGHRPASNLDDWMARSPLVEILFSEH